MKFDILKEERKIITGIDNKEFLSKPKENEIGGIKNRIIDNKFTTFQKLSEFQEEIIKGKTIIPSAIKGNASENWKKQQIFLIDIDNKIGDENIKVNDKRHISVEQALKICNEKNLTPTFIYSTFSDSEEQNRFRLVYILDKPIEDMNRAKEFINFLHNELKELNPDSTKKNLGDMFFGGKEILDTSTSFYSINVEKYKEDKKEELIEEEETEIVTALINGEYRKFKLPSEYFLVGDSIYYEKAGGKNKDILLLSTSPIVILSNLNNVDTGEQKVELAFKKNNEWKVATFSRSDVYGNSCNALLNVGVPFSPDKFMQLKRYLFLFENENDLSEKKLCSKLGWRDGDFIPFSNQNNVYVDVPLGQRKWLDAYNSKGTLEEWVEKIKPFRKNNIFRFILSASFAAPLLKIIGHRIFIVYNWGNSRAGKSACLKAALSVWGNHEDLTLSFNTTVVGIERLASLYNDLPLALDEKSISKSKDELERLIYMLGAGISRIRGNKIGGIQELNTWNTIVLATGEETISDENSRTGILTRTLEIEGSPFDNDEEKASSIYGIIKKQYGTAGRVFINKLIEEYSENEFVNLKNRYSEILEEVKKYTSNDVLPYISSVALIILADELVSKWIFNETDTKDSIQMGINILETLDKSNEIDVVDKCYNYIISWILSSHKSFEEYAENLNYDRLDEDLITTYNHKSFGIYDKNIYYVLPNILNDKLENSGYPTRKILSEFGKRGYILTTQRDGKIIANSIQKKFRGKNVRMYAFPIEEAEETKEIRVKREEEKNLDYDFEKYSLNGLI